MKGSRVQAVVQELRGEKIDIVPYDPDPARFVCNAIAPAEVARVIIDAGSHTMELIVPDEKLSLAIGKKGQNVRLASQLTGWRIDIHSESKVREMEQRARQSLAAIDGGEGGGPLRWQTRCSGGLALGGRGRGRQARRAGRGAGRRRRGRGQDPHRGGEPRGGDRARPPGRGSGGAGRQGGRGRGEDGEAAALAAAEGGRGRQRAEGRPARDACEP